MKMATAAEAATEAEAAAAAAEQSGTVRCARKVSENEQKSEVS